MKKLVIFIALALSLSLACPAFAVPGPSEPSVYCYDDGTCFQTFSDLADDDDAIIEAHRLGVVTGYGDWKFHPRKLMTAEELTQMVYNLYAKEFSPRSEEAPWWANAVRWLQSISEGEVPCDIHAASVSIEDAITLIYLGRLSSTGGQPRESFRADALRWANAMGCPVVGAWRHDLPIGNSDELSRGDACRLIVMTYEMARQAEFCGVEYLYL